MEAGGGQLTGSKCREPSGLQRTSGGGCEFGKQGRSQCQGPTRPGPWSGWRRAHAPSVSWVYNRRCGEGSRGKDGGKRLKKSPRGHFQKPGQGGGRGQAGRSSRVAGTAGRGHRWGAGGKPAASAGVSRLGEPARGPLENGLRKREFSGRAGPGRVRTRELCLREPLPPACPESPGMGAVGTGRGRPCGKAGPCGQY